MSQVSKIIIIIIIIKKKDKREVRTESVERGERVVERILFFLFLYSFLSQIYENRTVGFRQG